MKILESAFPAHPQGPPSGWGHRRGYLDTANYGLPHASVVEALYGAIDLWRTGQSKIDHWVEYCDRARTAYANYVGVTPSQVACSSATSHLVGLVASSLQPGSRVLVPSEEFTSNVFPWLAQTDRGIAVDVAPIHRFADSINSRHDIVAFSLVQSADGAVADIAAIRSAAATAGARVLIDLTQACGWLPVDASWADYTVCSLYKWIMAPRGCALLTVREDRLGDIRPATASWFGGGEIYESLYGPPLRLSGAARRLDLSPAWINWAGAAAALDHIVSLPADSILQHDLELAARFRAVLGLPDGDSPIVSVPVALPNDAIKDAGLTVSTRSGQLRISFHVYNDLEDVRTITDLIREGASQPETLA